MAKKVEEQYFRLSVNSVAFQGDHPLVPFSRTRGFYPIIMFISSVRQHKLSLLSYDSQC